MVAPLPVGGSFISQNSDLNCEVSVTGTPTWDQIRSEPVFTGTVNPFIVLMSSDKRKLSGLTELELQLAYNSLLKLKKAIVYEGSVEEEDPNVLAPEDFEQQVDTMLSLLGSKPEGPRV